MGIYRIPFKKTVWGYLEVEAKSLKAVKKGEYEMELDEFDNKSDYEFDYKNVERRLVE